MAALLYLAFKITHCVSLIWAPKNLAWGPYKLSLSLKFFLGSTELIPALEKHDHCSLL